MNWVLLIGALWLIVAALVAVLVGRGIRLADRKESEATTAADASPNFVVDGRTPTMTDPAEPAAAPDPEGIPPARDLPSRRPLDPRGATDTRRASTSVERRTRRRP
jgi:hypothetical protein